MQKEVFRAGTFTDSSGKTRTWTSEDVKKIVDNFNNEKEMNSEGYKVPLFLAHPDNEAEAPALGWVKKVWMNGKSLFAEFDKLTEKAEEAIKDFSFRDVSISVYKNILQHIGLTNTPAVSGLADFQYDAPHKDAETWTYTQTQPNKGEDMDQIEKLTRENEKVTAKLTAAEADLAEVTKKVDAKDAEIATLAAEKKEIESKLSEAEKNIETINAQREEEAKAASLAADTTFIQDLVKCGKLKPSEKDEQIAILSQFPAGEMKFSRDGKENKTSPKEAYKNALNQRDVILENGSHYANGENVSDKESKLQKLSRERMDKTGESYGQASLAVMNEHPELN